MISEKRYSSFVVHSAVLPAYVNHVWCTAFGSKANLTTVCQKYLAESAWHLCH